MFRALFTFTTLADQDLRHAVMKRCIVNYGILDRGIYGDDALDVLREHEPETLEACVSAAKLARIEALSSAFSRSESDDLSQMAEEFEEQSIFWHGQSQQHQAHALAEEQAHAATKADLDQIKSLLNSAQESLRARIANDVARKNEIRQLKAKQGELIRQVEANQGELSPLHEANKDITRQLQASNGSLRSDNMSLRDNQKSLERDVKAWKHEAGMARLFCRYCRREQLIKDLRDRKENGVLKVDCSCGKGWTLGPQ